MPRASPIPPGDWDLVKAQMDEEYSEAYSGPSDSIGFEIKPETCGYLNGKPVVIDYGDPN